MQTIDIGDSSRAVSALSDSDLVIACGSGGLASIEYGNLSKQTMGTLSHSTRLSVKEGDWVRIAETQSENASFQGLIAVTHPWGSGKPVPIFCMVAGSSANVDSFSATSINEESTRLTTTSSHNAVSFPSIRFVKADGKIYVELKFGKTSATYIFATLSNACYLSLIDATISTATDDKVLKTINFLRGGVSGYFTTTYKIRQKGGAHDDARNLGCAECGIDGYVGFWSLDAACECLGRICEDGGCDGESVIAHSGCERYKGLSDCRNIIAEHQYTSCRECDADKHSVVIFLLPSDTKIGRWRRNILPSVRRGRLVSLEESNHDSCVVGKEVAA